jgi:polysaccharide biosynthesis protein PelD
MEKVTESKFLGLRSSAIIEIFLFFCIVFAIASIFGLQLNYFDITPHPFWIIVLAMSARYGVCEGILAAGVATAVLILGPLPPRSPLEDPFIYTFTIIKNPILWLVLSVVLGESRSKQKNELAIVSKKLLESESKEEKMAKSYTDLKNLKERLEIRISAEMQTVISAIKSFKEIEMLDKERLLDGACDLVEVIIAPEKFSIFFLENDTLSCLIKRGWDHEGEFKKIIESNHPLFKAVVHDKKMTSILITKNEILNNEGVLAAPILSPYTKEVIGMIKIEQIPFLRLKLVTTQSLEILGEWIGTSYANLLEKKRSS